MICLVLVVVVVVVVVVGVSAAHSVARAIRAVVVVHELLRRFVHLSEVRHIWKVSSKPLGRVVGNL